MAKENDTEFLALVEKSAGRDGKFLLMVKEKAKQRMVEDPSAANVRAFNESTRALNDFLSKNAMPEESQGFASPRDVLAHLGEEGWKLKRSTLYKHIKENLLPRQPDGSFTVADVQKYTRLHLKPLGTDKDASDKVSDIKIKLLEQELRRSTTKAKLDDITLEEKLGQVISREDADLQMAQGVTILRGALKNFFESSALEIIHLVAGDPTKMDALLDFCTGHLNECFNGFARKRDYEVKDDGERQPD